MYGVLGNLLQSKIINCPYCGELLEILLDLSAGSQSYIEDCQVCCRPMELQLVADENQVDNMTVVVKRDDE